MDYPHSSSDYGVAGTDANASILGNGRRGDLHSAAGRMFPVEVTSNLVGERFPSELTFVL